MVDRNPPTSSLGPVESVRAFRHVFEQFTLRVAEEPTVDAVLEVADSLTGLPIVLTDGDGNVLRASRAIDDGIEFHPPPVNELIDVPIACGESLCATATTVPGSMFAWLVGGAGRDEFEVLLAVTLTAEYASMLDRYSVSVIPEMWRQRGRLVRLMVEAGPPERIRALADEIGHDLARAHHVVVIESTLGIDAPRFAMSIGSRIQEFGLLAPIEGRVVVVVGDARNLHPLVEVLRSTTDVGPFRVGISAVVDDGSDLSRAHSQAITCCEELPLDDGPTVAWYDERDPIAMMVRVTDEETVRRYIESALGPLLSYDGPHREEFLETLRVWIDSTDSLDAVAERLHIHRSTLVYRIRRIKEVLGHDLRDPEDRFGISIAFRMLDRVEATGGSGT